MSLSMRRLKVLKEKILLERSRIVNAFNDISNEKYLLNNDNRPDSVDQATADYQRSQMLRFRNRDHFYKKKLDKAFDKFSSDEFGVCEDCSDDIKYERLFARPTAELCISCKDEAEKEEQSNFLARQSKSMSKRLDTVSVV